MPLADFHPAVAAWFASRFPAPTEAQRAAWPAIRAGRHTLVAAPTGSGKTLTAFLAAIDVLVREGVARGGALPGETFVVYVSPLKALSNDIGANLEAPLAGIRAELERLGLPQVAIRTGVRTGDTPAAERRLTLREPPHLLVTTPESLYVLVGSASGRRMLAGVRTVIVDEIHALAANKRGSHLALTLERLQAVCRAPLQRIGLSATQKPIDVVARFLVGRGTGEATARAGSTPRGQQLLFEPEASAFPALPAADRAATDAAAVVHEPGCPAPANAAAADPVPVDCTIVDIGYRRRRDLALELPPTPLSAVMSNDQWEQVYARVAELALQHRTTLVFVNTRRMAERAARHLTERLGKERVATHHGSLSRDLRLDAEQRLKRGELTLLVATASLELGLDIGDVELVCQLGSPRAIATFLQRAGRAGHAVDGTPKARLFPQTRDELVECAALLDAVGRGELDALRVPPAPIDVLAQQLVAEVASDEWQEDALYALVRRAEPYAALPREHFDEVLRMLAEGYTTRQGPRGAYLHRDSVSGSVRARRGARMTALTSGGTIPETGDYAVWLEPQAERIGTVNEDFAIESLAGDIFQLGNTSYRILRVEPGRLRVEDAKGAPPNIPFWLGEAPGRSDELSFAVQRLRIEVEAALAATPPGDARIEQALAVPLAIEGVDAAAAQQIVDYLAAAAAVLGGLPTQRRLVLERFFDASGGMQLVLHAPWGSRVNRAWGLALRKRFCRQFNFELQAAATEDAIVLSLSTSHSFDLADVARYLRPATALDVLTQALLDAPLFGARWRWNATNALALPRMVGGRKVAPQLQRMKAEDLLAAVFPDQVACFENLTGARVVPDHPLVAQTLHDCLYEAMDTAGWLEVLRRLEAGEIEVVARDLPTPSPLADEVLNAKPYAFLDDAPLEERRTQAVQRRRYGEAEPVGELGRLDPQAIDAVRDEAWPEVRSADEMHEALMALGVVTDAEVARGEGWSAWLAALAQGRRATRLALDAAGDAAPKADAEPRIAVAAGPADSTDGAQAGAAGAVGGIDTVGLWVAVERLGQALALHPQASPQPPLAVPAGTEPATREDALRELLRARLGGLGPVTAATLAAQLAVDRSEVEGALETLRAEGSVMAGTITPGAPETEWCERHLLARIHRYTLNRLRREIEPVEPRDFQRFLLEWQHVGAEARVSGAEALPAVLAQLEGYEAPAALWEAELLPARVADYVPAWLDELCVSGRTLWTRLRPVAGVNAAADVGSTPGLEGLAAPASDADRPAPTGAPRPGGGRGSLRATPILLLPRRSAATWALLAAADTPAPPLGSRAQRVANHLAAHGASFFDELAEGAHLLRAELEDALAELVVAGRIGCDSYAGLRALLMPAAQRAAAGRSRRHLPLRGIEDAGRWALLRAPVAPSGALAAGMPDPDPAVEAGADPAAEAPRAADARATAAAAAAATNERVEHVARTLLRRYGVVCWRLLEREAAWLPPWRELVRVYRRLEARGDIRGGRFIAGVPGEQFALPDAIGALREARRRPADGALVVLAAADPANLLGSVLPGARVPRIAGARVVYRDGLPVAARGGGAGRAEIEWLQPLEAPLKRLAERLLALEPALRPAAAAQPTQPAHSADPAG